MSQEAIKHFSKYDPVLAEFARNIGLLYTGKVKRSRFEALVESIVSQQLSVKAADTIFLRFVAIFNKPQNIKKQKTNSLKLKFPTPEIILQTSITKFRKVGISNNKALYIKDLASKIVNRELKLNQLARLTDEEVITELTKVKGIGRWTAEMFLMFSLMRPDVFSSGDLGLRNGIAKLYKMKKPPTQKQLDRISKKWSPHRTIASRYIWKSLDNI